MMNGTEVAITSELVDALNPSLLRLAMRMVGRQADAEDLVQETWFSALSSVHTYQARAIFRTWLGGIMRRRHIDRFRKQRWTETYEDDDFAAPCAEPGDWVDARTLAKLAAQAAEPLTQLEISALRLCDLEEMDRGEAALQLGITRGHLRVVLHRAHHKLERLMQRAVCH